MLKTVAFMLVGVLLGAGALSLWRATPSDPPPQAARGTDTGLAQRVETLEASLGQEKTQREALAAQIGTLKSRLDKMTLAARTNGAGTEAGAVRPPNSGASEDAAAPGPARAAAASRNANREQRRIDRLVAGGFTRQRAEWIAQQADGLRMQALEARYEAIRAGKPYNPQAAASDVKTLHEVLGDQEYAQYLSALGRPTSIPVRNVLPSSPAQQAGLKPGDQVVGYAGQRVFDVGELNRLTLVGAPGEQVEVDVVRDGTQMQLYVPRGPLGIAGRWFRGRP